MSSELAKRYHSMTFTYVNEWNDTNKKHGTVNTWDDWHLVPTSRPVFSPPKPKTSYVDIPGADGRIDLSDALTGYPVYDNREGSIEFIVMNGYRSSWASGYSKFSNWLHGQKVRVVLDDDPSYFYEGRMDINDWKSNNDGTWSNITFNYNLKPYKYGIHLSTEDWLWDPFNFETDVIYKTKDINIHGITTLNIANNQMHVVPTFRITNTTDTKWKIELNGKSILVDIDPKKHPITTIKDPRLELLPGVNTIRIVSASGGKLDIIFRGGSL